MPMCLTIFANLFIVRIDASPMLPLIEMEKKFQKTNENTQS